MSASRRMQLLNWAQSSGSWIIEDDYDSEYRFESMPIASLQGLDRNARVIYIGTFSKVLFPSLRLGYIVIPPDLVDHFIAVRTAMDIFPPYLHQEVITDFMREGHFARHIRRMRLLYSERRTALVENIRDQFGSCLEVHGTQAGMHLSVTLPKGLSDREIATRAARKGTLALASLPVLFKPGSPPGFRPGIWQHACRRYAPGGEPTARRSAQIERCDGINAWIARVVFHVTYTRIKQRDERYHLRVAIDTGGTFTDCVYLAAGELQVLKVFSTPTDPSQAVLDGLGAHQRRQSARRAPRHHRGNQHHVGKERSAGGICNHGGF